MPRTPGRGVSKEDPDYLEKRAKNNEAIKRSREKARNRQKETEAKVEALRNENKNVESKIVQMESQLNLLKGLFKAHAASIQAANASASQPQGSDLGVAGPSGCQPLSPGVELPSLSQDLTFSNLQHLPVLDRLDSIDFSASLDEYLG